MIMKRGNLLKVITGIATALFVANGTFGQDVQGGTDYEAISGANTEIDSVTVGSTTRLYVKPDAYFHPGYVNPTWTLTAGFTWDWVIPGGAGTADAGEVNTDEWVQVDWSGTAGGPYNIVVTETAPAAYGGCSGDTNVYVSVIASPTATFTADNPGTIIGADLTVCEGDARLADIVQSTMTGVTTLQLEWTLEIATLSSLGAKDEYFDLDKASLGAVQAFAINRAGTVANPQETGLTALTFDFDKPNDGTYTAIQPAATKKATVYTYTINGINDRISRKSDYLGNSAGAADGWTWYDTTAETIVIRVNPAPVTGPIYHIPNDWQP